MEMIFNLGEFEDFVFTINYVLHLKIAKTEQNIDHDYPFI